MRSAAPVNADPSKVARVDTNAMPWEKSEQRGVWRKVLEFVNDAKKGRETALLKFDPGAALPAETLTERLDIYVLEGVLADGEARYGAETFVRIPPGSRVALSSNAGCVIVGSAMKDEALARGACIVADDPYLYFARLTRLWRQQHAQGGGPRVHPSAVVDPEAVVDPSASIGPLCVVERGARIDRVILDYELKREYQTWLHERGRDREAPAQGDRLDLEPGVLDGRPREWGTTNVDFNPPMRAALARVHDDEALLLHVGHDEVRLESLAGSAVEKKVPLPERWLKGFAEVQVASAEKAFHDVVTLHLLERLLERLVGGSGRPTLAATRIGSARSGRAGGHVMRGKVRVHVHVDDRRPLLGEERRRRVRPKGERYGGGAAKDRRERPPSA